MNNRETAAVQHFHNATKYMAVGDGVEDEDILMGTPPNLGPALGEQDRAIEPYPYKTWFMTALQFGDQAASARAGATGPGCCGTSGASAGG
jgi:hypothetical protein